jgi:hypothetical protein
MEKQFSDNEYRFVGLNSKTLKNSFWGSYLEGPEFRNSEYAGHQVGAYEAVCQNFTMENS